MNKSTNLDARNSHLPRVAIVYAYLTLYHATSMRQLLNSSIVNIELYSGTNAGPTPIKVVSQPKEKQSYGIQFKNLNNHWLGNILWQSGVISLSCNNAFDVVIYAGNCYYISTWIAAIIGRIRGQKTLMKTHGMLRPENGLKGIVRRSFYRLSHGLLLYEHRARKLLMQKGFNPDRLYVTYNSLDYEIQKKVRSQLSNNSDMKLKASVFSGPTLPLLVFVGRLTVKKQLDLLIKAVGLLCQKGFPVNAVIIGDGSEKMHLVREVFSLGFEKHCIFVGEMHDEESVGPWLHAADVCVSPGEVGLTAIHSFAYGTPVITHNDFNYQGPEVEAIVANRTGAFFERGSVEDLASVIKEWLNHSHDRELTRMNCINVIERYYNPNVQVKVITDAIFDILRGASD